LGARAWVDRYGLVSALDRVLAPPIAPTARRPDWTPERLAEVNTSLAASPFRGLAVACPYTPDVARAATPAAALAELTRFVVEEVVPAARALAPIAPGPGAVRIDGCSMGGPLALELFLARPDAFGGVGVVQPAMGPHRAPGYAARLRAAYAAHHRGPVHVLTSQGDPFRPGARALARSLGEAGVPVALREAPGPHDQPWLRETGSIELLLAHERGAQP
jgi:enterochelin esterase-like enzyme